ncbi:hypothetical protein [Winogradskyella sp. PE311]|uniref:hypothetical protein n=1 Tax=Winogradskyella sp. PE311 TaxID=3366943 RepID=UPI00398006E9
MEQLRQNYSKANMEALNGKVSANKDTANRELKTKAIASIVLIALGGLIALSYMTNNIFTERIAVCAFIISCIVLIKLSNENGIKK